jgi:predicted nucleotidyltransferase
MVDQKVLKTAKSYAALVRSRFPTKQVILFGSFARGTAHRHSDIDIAVVLKKEPASVWKTQAELFKLARQVDARIEPLIMDDILDPSGFCEEINRYGRVVYRSRI